MNNPSSTSSNTQQAGPVLSANIVAEALSADAPNAIPDGTTSTNGRAEASDLPTYQARSPVMVEAHRTVTERFGSDITNLSLAESQALQTQLMEHEKRLLTTKDPAELFAPLDPRDLDFVSSDAAKPPTQDDEVEQPFSEVCGKLSLLDYTQIREENSRLMEVNSIRATADLVVSLRQDETSIPGRRRGQVPLAAATSYVASALRLTQSAVDKRVTAANAMWPAQQYRRTKVMIPRLAAALERGNMPLDSFAAAQENLSEMRQAVRRAGGDNAVADQLVDHSEQEMRQHATQNNAYTFSRFAKSQKRAVTKQLVGPKQALTDTQVQHEKGVFYEAKIGDSLHRLTVVVDDAELLQITAFREFATKLNSEISTLRATAQSSAQAQRSADGTQLTSEDENAGDDVPTSPRITPEDIDLGIGQLFDGQTKAERWLNTWMDFASAGLILHKTYDPNATPEEQEQRDQALKAAAEHSEIIADILGIDTETVMDGATDPPEHPPRTEDPLASLVPSGYQLLRPNLDMIVEITLQDLTGEYRLTDSAYSDTSEPPVTSEIRKITEILQRQQRHPSAPSASPGSLSFDVALARQQACHQRLIPMVLGSSSQPLDVGRAQRSFPHAIRRALHVRDRGCIVPGCPRPSTWCEPHHIVPWADDGDTSLANAALLCRHHHGAVHKRQIIIHAEPDGIPTCSLPRSLDPTQTRYRNVFWQQ